VFKWATFVTTKAAVKVHTMLDIKGSIPAFFHISKGNVHDVNFLDLIEYEAGAYYVMDRGYLDYERLYKINQAGAFFVTRAKHNTAFARLYSHQVDKTTGVRCDQVIKFSGHNAAKDYPDKLRRIKYFDKETNHYYVFLTNDLNTDTKTIADVYKHRWQIELFFKWIKGHLKITAFWGHSDNAVRTQICIAICAYLIVAIIKRQLHVERNLNEILQILNVSSLVKTPLFHLISETVLQDFEDRSQKQATLWGY
jgi:IS4 transposase